ncbi:MAG: hypothetical protein PHC53_03645 [Patescibacteria group bacterium]|nr:hypothetical protein [Patescibacteria group bacterium]
MQSFDKVTNPFLENKPTAAQLRDDYQSMMTTADREFKKVESLAHATDSRIVQAWQQRREEKAIKAAQLIIEQVGKMEVADLREAVAPEDLKEVLLRGGAGVEALIMIGEGKEEIQKVVEERQRQIAEIQKAVDSFEGSSVQTILGRLLMKLKEAEAKLATYERKEALTRDQAREYALTRMKFSEQLMNALSASEQYKEEAARQKKKKEKGQT